MHIRFDLHSGAPQNQDTPCLLVAVFAKKRLSDTAKQLDRASGKKLSALLARGDLEGEAGQSLLLHDLPGVRAERVLLIGCGEPKSLDADRFLHIIRHAVQTLGATGAKEAVCHLCEIPVPDQDAAWRLRQAVIQAAETMYRFQEMKSKPKKTPFALKKLRFAAPDGGARATRAAKQAIKEGDAIAQGIQWTRDLANRPANVCTPSHLAKEARQFGKKHSIQVTVLNEAQMRKLGMGSLLSVAQGAKEPAKFIVMKHQKGKVYMG